MHYDGQNIFALFRHEQRVVRFESYFNNKFCFYNEYTR